MLGELGPTLGDPKLSLGEPNSGLGGRKARLGDPPRPQLCGRVGVSLQKGGTIGSHEQPFNSRIWAHFCERVLSSKARIL